MQFVLIGLDGTDKDAPSRRMAVRASHIALGDKLMAAGNMWYGAALLHDEGTMKGSMLLMNFPSEDALNEWLKVEPYVTGDVWRSLTIHKCNVRDPWQFSKPQEFFEQASKA